MYTVVGEFEKSIGATRGKGRYIKLRMERRDKLSCDGAWRLGQGREQKRTRDLQEREIVHVLLDRQYRQSILHGPLKVSALAPQLQQRRKKWSSQRKMAAIYTCTFQITNSLLVVYIGIWYTFTVTYIPQEYSAFSLVFMERAYHMQTPTNYKCMIQTRCHT